MQSKRAFFVAVSALCMWFVGSTRADAVVIFNFDDVVTGFTPGGTPPWATLTISDAGANTVNFTLTHNSTSAAGQFISQLWLNMDPFPGSPAIIESSPKIVGAVFGQDSVANAGLVFDMAVSFETSNAGGGVNRLKPGESVSWQITGSGLDESAFNALSQGSEQRLAMLHLQGIEGGLSGKVAPVPEPASILGLAIAAVGLVARKRRRA